jgi:hypothetical protein
VTGVARHLTSPGDQPSDLPLAPFYRTHGRTYSVYFDVLTAPELDARIAALAAEHARAQRIEQAAVSFVQPGRASDEQTANYRSEPPSRPVIRSGERTARGGAGSFSYDLPVDATGAQTLLVTYHNDLGLPVLANFEIRVDGTTVGHYAPNRSATSFWDAAYPIPPSLTSGKSKVTVRLVAENGSRIVPVYGIRIIRGADVP